MVLLVQLVCRVPWVFKGLQVHLVILVHKVHRDHREKLVHQDKMEKTVLLAQLGNLVILVKLVHKVLEVTLACPVCLEVKDIWDIQEKWENLVNVDDKVKSVVMEKLVELVCQVFRDLQVNKGHVVILVNLVLVVLVEQMVWLVKVVLPVKW